MVTSRYPSLILIAVFLVCLSGLAGAMDPKDLLPPEKAFALTTQVKSPNEVVRAWDIAPGYYLYRNKFKFKWTNIFPLCINNITTLVYLNPSVF